MPRSLPILLLLLMFLLAAAAPALADAPKGAGWQTLREAPFTFHYRSEDTRIAGALAGMAPGSLDSVIRRTGLDRPRNVDVVLAADVRTFDSVQPSPPPSWAAGTAWPERSEIYLKTRLPRSGPNRIDQVFTHEVVHVVLGRSWQHGHPPRWLTEGMAKYLAGELGVGDQAVLAQAALGGRLLPLESFTRDWPTRAAPARLAYVQSVDFIAFLGREGEDVLPTLVRRMAAGEDLDAALRVATGGEGLAELEARWRARITIWHSILGIVGSSSAPWAFAAVLFVFAAWKQRRNFRRKVARMERDELERASLTPGAPEDAAGSIR